MRDVDPQRVVEVDAQSYCDAYGKFLDKYNKRHDHIQLNKFKKYCGIEHLCRQYRMQPPVFCSILGQKQDLFVVDEKRWIIARLKFGI